MARKKHSVEQIIHKLREVEVLLSQGKAVAEVCRSLGITEQTDYRWRNEYSGLRMEQARRLKRLEQENTRVQRQVLGFSRDEIVSNDRIQRVEVWKSLPAGIEIAGDGVSLKLRAGMRESELTALRDQIRRRVRIRP